MLTKLEADDGIIIKMSDGSTYKGDILVGADGACSTVRQRLFDRLKNEGRLCKGDREHLPYRSVCLAGQTRALDPSELPQFNNKSLCEFHAVIEDGRPYTVSSNSVYVKHSHTAISSLNSNADTLLILAG